MAVRGPRAARHGNSLVCHSLHTVQVQVKFWHMSSRGPVWVARSSLDALSLSDSESVSQMTVWW